jgi:dTMP kinase
MGRLARDSTYYLRGLPLSLLMAADRYHHQEHVIAPALEAGQLVVCDRYVTTAVVLDQLDGADPEYIWNVYRYLRRPDLAVVLLGDPAVCRARAANRGVYSRFHEGGADAGRAETALFARCAHLLAGVGYPISILPIGDDTAGQVADAVVGLIQDRMTTHKQ